MENWNLGELKKAIKQTESNKTYTERNKLEKMQSILKDSYSVAFILMLGFRSAKLEFVTFRLKIKINKSLMSLPIKCILKNRK